MLITFSLSLIQPVSAQEISLPVLPKPGVRVGLSPEYRPSVLRGVTFDPNKPFKFDFILDKGEKSGTATDFELKEESTRLVKYFLSAITTPEKDLWVNLSPYEKDRIIPESFAQTDMGRDLLAQDYLLKQITSSLMYPEEELGKRFWKRIYEEAAKQGITNVPVNTFNKVWIVPDKAKVYEHGNTAFVVKSRLKVMLEEDYVATIKNNGVATSRSDSEGISTNEFSKNIIKDIIIPALEIEVNEGKNFAQLRQVYQSLILAVWFKKRMKDSILGHKYMDQNKVAGIEIEDKDSKQKIYEQYLKAFKKGVYNYIKEEADPMTQQVIPRKYFAGGVVGAFKAPEDFAMTSVISANEIPDSAQMSQLIVNLSDKGNDQALVATRELELKFWGKWRDELTTIFASKVKRWDSVDLSEKIEKLAQLTDEDIVNVVSDFKAKFPQKTRVELSLSQYDPRDSMSVGLDMNQLKESDDNFVKNLKRVVDYVMPQVSSMLQSVDQEYWKRVSGVVQYIIAANSQSRFHKGDHFRLIMSKAVIQTAQELYANPKRMSYEEIFNRMVNARKEVATILDEKNILTAFDVDAIKRRAGQGGALVTTLSANGKYKKLYQQVQQLFTKYQQRVTKHVNSKNEPYQELRLSLDADFASDFPNELRKYEQRIIFDEVTGEYNIFHPQAKYVPAIERYLATLWDKMIDPVTPLETKYRFLAEFEWWSFQGIVMGRSGAALTDAMSLTAQIVMQMPLRREFQSLDFEALSRTLAEYIQYRRDDLIANQLRGKVDGVGHHDRAMINQKDRDEANQTIKVSALKEQIKKAIGTGEVFQQRMADVILKEASKFAQGSLIISDNFMGVFNNIKEALVAMIPLLQIDAIEKMDRYAALTNDSRLKGDESVSYTYPNDDNAKQLVQLIRERIVPKMVNDVFKKEYEIRGYDKKYTQTVRLDEESGGLRIEHANGNQVPFIMAHLKMLWETIHNKSENINDKKKALAEFEWWFFQANPLGRAGASMGDAMSFIAQINLGIQLRDQYVHQDYQALSLEKDEYIEQRVKELSLKEVGGIDLTADRMSLDIEKDDQRDKGQISQPVDLKALENIEINALYIKDIDIKPITNLFQMLGVAQ